MGPAVEYQRPARARSEGWVTFLAVPIFRPAYLRGCFNIYDEKSGDMYPW